MEGYKILDYFFNNFKQIGTSPIPGMKIKKDDRNWKLLTELVQQFGIKNTRTCFLDFRVGEGIKIIILIQDKHGEMKFYEIMYVKFKKVRDKNGYFKIRWINNLKEIEFYKKYL